MYQYIVETNYRKLEFESIHHMANMNAFDFYGMPIAVFEDAKMAINLLQVKGISIDGVPYQLRSYAVQ